MAKINSWECPCHFFLSPPLGSYSRVALPWVFVAISKQTRSGQWQEGVWAAADRRMEAARVTSLTDTPQNYFSLSPLQSNLASDRIRALGERLTPEPSPCPSWRDWWQRLSNKKRKKYFECWQNTKLVKVICENYT